jgi:hypothetical protein
MALHLLCGRFDVQQTGLLDPANLRFFTEETLQSLVDRSGWHVVGREDLHSLYSQQYDADLRNGLPEEMVGALQATAEAVNPNWSVTHFVWALEPQAVEMAPTSYLEAVSPAEPPPTSRISRQASETVATYLASVGLVVSETNRRAVIATRNSTVAAPRKRLKPFVLNFVYRSPRRAALFKRLYRQLGGKN